MSAIAPNRGPTILTLVPYQNTPPSSTSMKYSGGIKYVTN